MSWMLCRAYKWPFVKMLCDLCMCVDSFSMYTLSSFFLFFICFVYLDACDELCGKGCVKEPNLPLCIVCFCECCEEGQGNFHTFWPSHVIRRPLYVVNIPVSS